MTTGEEVEVTGLTAGFNTFRIKVTSKNGSVEQTYALTITRHGPPTVSIAPSDAQTVVASNNLTLPGAGEDPDAGAVTFAWSAMRGTTDVTSSVFPDGTTGLYPYGRWTLADGTELRGLVGAGRGVARHRSDDAATDGAGEETSRLSMWMASTGIRWSLPSISSLSIAAQGDLGWVRMKTADGPDGMDGLSANGWRMRVGVEASRPAALADGSSVEPFVEAAGRRDGGDGLTGTGLEIGAGCATAPSACRVEARGRWLATHTEDGVRELGMTVQKQATQGGV